ncbi:hypothetical protein [Lactobacillus xylocopicola]|uniref:Uncharacterized protein n=1 Tax=Lactobacillus xylocopicola TaxID=2976676 RepID=A0ABN6SMQ9_9LACO|nr:hypothetical protein [Lactobacillus xylocopicola]BDR60959.1 hypothetical protein KIM322_12200 [Lactobacillus xylocopicola]
MAKKYLSQHSRTRHTYQFFKERRNDPKWHDDYLRIRSLRLRLFLIQGMVVILLAIIGGAFLKQHTANQSQVPSSTTITSTKPHKTKKSSIGEKIKKNMRATQHTITKSIPSNHRQTKKSDNKTIVRNFILHQGYQIEPKLVDNEPIDKAMADGKAPQNAVHDGVVTVYFADSSTVMETLLGSDNPKFESRYYITENKLVLGKHRIPYKINGTQVLFKKWLENFDGHEYTYEFKSYPGAKQLIDSKPKQ